jgi:hypothetical protein
MAARIVAQQVARSEYFPIASDVSCVGLVRAELIKALYPQRGSEYHVIGGTAKSPGRAVADASCADIFIDAELVEPMYTKTEIAKNEKSVQAAIPAYADQKQRVTEIIEQETANGDDPYDVAEVVYDVASAKSPRLRYPVGEGVMLSRLYRFIPARLFDSVFRRRLQLDGPPAMGDKAHEKLHAFCK